MFQRAFGTEQTRKPLLDLSRFEDDNLLVSLAIFFVSLIWIPAIAMSVLYLAGAHSA
jgi:hypothetical protein